MTPEKLLKTIEIYRKFFVDRGFRKIDYPHDELLIDEKLGLEHCHGMLDKMVKFIGEGRQVKAFRWLCFIQGCLWMQGLNTLSEFKDHNRSDPDHR